MKRKNVIFIVLGLSAMSCQKEIVKPENGPLDFTKKSQNQTFLFPQISTTYFDWETNSHINITDGSSRILPWVSGAATSIPSFILEDYKKADGWELIYNLCREPGELGQNYIMFYNKFTGILRTYYFLADNVSTGSNGLWGISLTGNNALLNNTGYFADPITTKKDNPIYITSNITNESISKTISKGWNAFDTEFTFDPQTNQQLRFGVVTFNKNIQNITLTGNIELNSSGTIVASSNKNNWSGFKDSAVKGAGNTAKDYVVDKLQSTNNKGNKIISAGIAALAEIASGGVKYIISNGINLLFGSFIGKQNSTANSTQKIEFKTNGTMGLTGTITGSEATNVTPVANLSLPGYSDPSAYILPYYNKKLGVWNLNSVPKVKVAKNATRGPLPNLTEEQAANYNYMAFPYTRRVSIDQSSIEVSLNPEVLSEISNYEVTSTLMIYKKFGGNANWNPVGTPINYMTKFREGDLKYDDDTSEISQFNSFEEYTFGNIPGHPMVASLYDLPAKLEINNVDNRYVVKVTIKLFPKAGYNQEPIVLTRSYIPQYVVE